jgi:hypothetical protein
LEKALDSTRGKMNVIITLNEIVDANDIISTHMVRGNNADVKEQVFGLLKERCGTSQHFLKDLCSSMEAKGNVTNVTSFWLANAISMQCDAEAS